MSDRVIRERRSEFVPSAAAQAEGVCHTREECFQLYEAIDPQLKLACILSLHDALTKDAPTLEALLDAKVHLGAEYVAALPREIGAAFFFGMSVRNYMRQQGFGERELDVHNLDCVFEQFLRDAVREEAINRAAPPEDERTEG